MRFSFDNFFILLYNRNINVREQDMRAEELISAVSKLSEEKERFEKLKKEIPLGEDVAGQVVTALKAEKPLTVRHIAVTGGGRSGFIRRLLVTISCLYERTEACFLILSPKTEYGELLRLKSMDATIPYIRTHEDLEQALTTLKELIRICEQKGTPRLILVLDGLEELAGHNKNGDLEEYRSIFELLMRRNDIDVITGADLQKSIFSGYPGAFAGIGNCLVSTREEGKADVTYVQDDCSLSLPVLVTYPDTPSIMETIVFLNALGGGYELSD